MVPHVRNPFFIGREDILDRIETALATGTSAALAQPQAISGLGGIGKTQTAVEYAYRHQDEYRAVLWVSAADETTLREGFVKVAQRLGLPQAQEDDQSLAIQAVKAWMEREGRWLLILDNADNPACLKPFLPPKTTGHVVLTSRVRQFAMLHINTVIDITALSPSEAVVFLLHRTGREAVDPVERTAAATLAEELGGLPLALEQAGAYIADCQSHFEDYLKSYRKRELDLLEKQTPQTGDYDKTVAITWSINFEAVAASSEASADLLRVSAFLAPDGIPEELLIIGASELGEMLAAALAGAGEDRLLVDDLLEPLSRYSLIQRDIERHTYDIHRLVQAVIKYGTHEDTQKDYAARLVRAVNHAFPNVEVSTWPVCERLLPHARVCIQYVGNFVRNVGAFVLPFTDATRLLNQVSLYLHMRAQYSEAETISEMLLSIRERDLEEDHPDIALSLNNLASLYVAKGNYTKAEPLLKRSISIYEKSLGLDHPKTAQSINNLANVYHCQNDNAEAATLCQRALAIREQVLGPHHLDTAQSLSNLGEIYREQGKFEEALPLYERALFVQESIQGADHPDLGSVLNGLAGIHRSKGNYAAALPLLERSLLLSEGHQGVEHNGTAICLNNLGKLYDDLGDYENAGSFLQKALAIQEKVLGPEHPETAAVLSNLGSIYRAMGNYAEAASLCQRALVIREQSLGPNHPKTAESLNHLADVYRDQGKYSEAKTLYQRSLAIFEEALGPKHPETLTALDNLARLYIAKNYPGAAEPLLKRVIATRIEVLGPHHPHTALALNNLASVYYNSGQYRLAETLLGRALAIYEEVMGPEHPETIKMRKNHVAVKKKLLFSRQPNHVGAAKT